MSQPLAQIGIYLYKLDNLQAVGQIYRAKFMNQLNILRALQSNRIIHHKICLL